MEKKHSALVVKDLRKRFGLEEVLKGLSLNANEGDVISLLGASGSGKNTFLRCINLLEIPDSGSVTVRGETTHMATDRAGNPTPADMKQVVRLRAQLGIVFHKFQSLVTHDGARQCGRSADLCAETIKDRSL
jgi:ABC-type histidine transport system ATPase subunit